MGTARLPMVIGLVGGLASGLMGIGGGVLLVPLLVMALDLPQRRAHATSLAAIAPIAVVATIVYAVSGDVSLPATLALAAGAVLGAPVGVRLLARANERILAGVFLLVAVVAGMRLLFG